jgi:hypothetical protein
MQHQLTSLPTTGNCNDAATLVNLKLNVLPALRQGRASAFAIDGEMREQLRSAPGSSISPQEVFMLRQLLLHFGFCVAASSAAMITAAEPPARSAPQGVLCQIRLLEGKSDGKREDGTLQILAEPAVTTLEGREASLEVGGRLGLPEARGNSRLEHP